MEYKLAKKERAALAARFPTLTLSIDEKGGLVTGVMEVTEGIAYTVHLVFSTRYPEEVPELFCRKEEIDWTADRHVYPDTNGKACLCVRSEYRKHWPVDSTLADFLGVLVWPYFVGQAYYDAHGCWPPDRERPHNMGGVIEAYEDLVGLPRGTDQEVVVAFMELISSRRHPPRTMDCPCGSTEQLHRCHGKRVACLRRTIDFQHATKDLDCVRRASGGR